MLATRVLPIFILTLFTKTISGAITFQTNEVYAATGCFFRMQIPRDGQSTVDARVTTLDWAETTQEVTHTINDFTNELEQNVQLWLDGGMSALLYFGLYQCSCVPIVPQNNLNQPGNALTIILPSGVAKLTKVKADSNQLNNQQNTATSGIFGISGTLAPEDYAYATGQALSEAVARFDQAFKIQGVPVDGQVQFNAVRGDGNTYVTIVMTMLR